MIYNIEDVTPLACGEPVNKMQPAIVEVDSIVPLHGVLYSPVLVDRAAGTVEMPVAYRLSLPDAFDAAIRLGQRLKSTESN